MHILKHSTYSNFCEKFFFRKEVRTMNNIQFITSKENECKDGGNGYKIIEINVSDPSENLFAVVTPIKNNK